MNEYKKKIIIAEDDPDLLAIMVKVLQERGYEVLGLPDGTLIMEDHCASPDLYILDKDMPFYDGVSITKHLREDSAQSVPILMVSADDETRDAASAGVDHYLLKPIQQGVFLTAIQKMLNRAQA